MTDTASLAAEIAELHADAVKAAQVARLCQAAAGQRLEEIRDSMRATDWSKWVRSSECPVSSTLVSRYIAAAMEVEG